MTRLLIFAFEKGGSREILELVDTPHAEKRVIGSGMRILEQFAEELRGNSFDALIGLGMARRGKHIRSEQTCHNRFRSHLIGEQPATYKLPDFLPLSEEIRPGNHIGASYCNAICYQIMKIAQPKHFSYFHIPRSIDAKIAACIISQSIISSRFL